MYRRGWVGSTSALARIAALVSLLAVTVLSRPNTPAQEKPYRGAHTTGMTTRRFTPKEPYNWRGAQDHALGTVIWYPAVSSAEERPVEVTGLTIFDLGSASQGAKIAAKPASFPLIVISHGTGGSGLSMAWLGEALARHGYIVAAVNHPGNTGTDPYTVEGFSIWWERARDLSEVISGMLADPSWGVTLTRRGLAPRVFRSGATL